MIFDKKIMNLSDVDTLTIFICRQFLTKTVQKEHSHINCEKYLGNDSLLDSKGCKLQLQVFQGL